LNLVAGIPGLLAIIWLIRRKSPSQTYLDVYLPSLLVMPGWCRWVLPALPDPSFCESAAIPVAAMFFLKGWKKWRPSFYDFLVVGYGGFIGYSEFVNAGFNEAQNLMFDMVASAMAPYFLAQAMAATAELRTAFAKRFVALMAFLACILTFEFKFGVNPYRMVFDRFFPGQGDGWVTTFRYGLARVAGPFGHAILAGAMFLIALRLARWLQHSKLWEPQFKKFRLPFSKAVFMTGGTALGLFMTLVRGPQIGYVIATIFTAMGRGRNPKRRALIVLVALLGVGVPMGVGAWSYASVGRAAAKDASQESAAYRKELIDKYVSIAMEHATLGWGRNGWPKVSGMPSIDNYYLLLCLMHGIPAAGLLLSILAVGQFRLMRNGFANAPVSPPGSSLSFTLAGILAGFMFTILTVYMGDNAVPIFFSIAGFGEGYLKAGGDAAAKLERGVPEAIVVKPMFARVIA
jgi:hypothetical protein